MTTNLETKLRLDGTVYASCKAKHAAEFITLQEWMERIRTGWYKRPIDLYRQNKAAGLDDVAQNIKQSLNAFLCAGVYHDERKESSPHENSNVYFVDYDRHEEAWSKEIVQRFQSIPWIWAAHETISHGARAFIGIGNVPDEFFKIYIRIALAKLDAIAGEQHDTHCEHRTQLSVACYDPDAWCRPVEECTETVPFTDEELAQIKKEHAGITARKSKSIVPVDFDLSKVSLDTHRNLSDKQITSKLEHFMQLYPYLAHQHHDALVRYGALSFNEGFSTSDLVYLVMLIAKEFPTLEYDAVEIERQVLYGYTHSGYYVKSRTSSPSNSPFGDDSYDSDENDSEVIESTCPYFTDHVYENLPPLFKKLLGAARTRRQKDFLLGSLFSVASSLMGKMFCHYLSDIFSPNLAFCAVAPAGTGKKIVMRPMALLKKVEKYFETQAEERFNEWQLQKRKWRRELSLAKKENREPDWTMDPGQPPVYHPFVTSANISNSALIDSLEARPDGLMQFASEMEVVSASDKLDYGALNATYRMAIENEPVFKKHRCDGRQIQIDFPRLSVVISGTFAHFAKFMVDVESGNLSRWALLCGSGNLQWNCLTAEKDDMDHVDEYTTIYSAAADEFFDLFMYMKEHRIDTYFHPDQFARFNGFFSFATEEIKRLHHTDLESLITRGPHLLLRIASILTGIRMFTEHSTETKVYIHEDDFVVAMEITRVFMRHACQLSTILPKPKTDMRPMIAIDPADEVFQQLPDKFTTAEAIVLLQKQLRIGRSSAFEKLKKWKEFKRIENLKAGAYRKIKEEAPAAETTEKAPVDSLDGLDKAEA